MPSDISPELDQIVHCFEQALRRGEPVSIEEVVEKSGSLGPRLLTRLLQTEIEFRRSQGMPIDWDGYAARFPKVGDALQVTRTATMSGIADDTSQKSQQDSVAETKEQYLDNSELLAPLSLNDYLLGDRLGGGGQGDVYLAEQRSLGRRVAVKVLKDTARDPQSVPRFLREARSLAQTQHPHIVTIHGIGKTPSGDLFLVMEYIDGFDLSKQMTQKPFTIVEAVRIIIDISLAIDHAHSRGVIHRDLKPSNVLWDAVRGAVVTDFGLAKDLRAADGLTVTEQLMGTPSYMAPEQAHRRFGEISERTDVYGLAATLFALLTGRPPYGPGPLMEILQQLISTDPVPNPRTLRPQIPAELNRICRRALAKYPSERHASVGDFVRDLERWLAEALSSESIEPPPTVVAEKLKPEVPIPFHSALINSEESSLDENLLHSVWDQLDAELQDAFSLAYNKKRRTGSTRISTRDLFEALGRLGSGPLRQMMDVLPTGALPEPADAEIPVDPIVLQEQPLLSDCVRDSLVEFQKMGPSLPKVAPVDLFVDVAKHGHGPSVVQLREHGVDPDAIERIVQQLGLRVVRRESPSDQSAGHPAEQDVDCSAEQYISHDNVQFSVYRPKTIAPDIWEPLLAFAHLSDLPPDAPEDTPDPLDEVRRQAAQVLGEKSSAYQSLTADSSQSIPQSSELTFVPTGDGLEFNPPQRAFRWLEPVHREEFRVRAATRLEGQLARGRLSVYLGRLLIAEVSIVMRVDRNAATLPHQSLSGENHATRFRRIFACVSRTDLAVVSEFRRYAQLLQDTFFTQQWQEETAQISRAERRRLIASADVFQLYWSHSAIDSPEVEQDWRYALSLGRPEFIRPLYWEEPFPTRPDRSLPPPELLALGFQKLPTAQGTSPNNPSSPRPGAIHGKLQRVRRPRVETSSATPSESDPAPTSEIRTAPDPQPHAQTTPPTYRSPAPDKHPSHASRPLWLFALLSVIALLIAAWLWFGR